MKVTTLKAKIRRLWIEVDGESEDAPPEKVWVDYRPNELTLEVSDSLQEIMATGFEADIAFAMLQPLLAGWDLTEDVLDADGNPTGETQQLPVDARGIKQVPIMFLGQIMQAIEEDARPNVRRDVNSEGSSLQVEQPDPSPTGSFS